MRVCVCAVWPLFIRLLRVFSVPVRPTINYWSEFKFRIYDHTIRLFVLKAKLFFLKSTISEKWFEPTDLTTF